MRLGECFYMLMGLLIGVSQSLWAQDVTREYDLQEVEVTAKRHNFGVFSSQMSANSLSIEQIKKMPMLLGEVDVLKSLQRLPGVQSSGEGRAGIFVRGGDFDQNLFSLDGITLYNPEHLQGFVSAMNADMTDEVVLYKGAFPARYGSRLSSIVDVGMREGDMNKYHATITAGMLASHIQAEGPIWKGHTSFNIAGRISYFKLIVRPLLEEVVYDNPGQMDNYSNMKYYDINAKITHRFSNSSKLTGTFYFGHDTNEESPEVTTQSYKYDKYEEVDGVNEVVGTEYVDTKSRSQNINRKENLLGGLTYTHLFAPNLRLDAGVSYSGYDYRLGYNTSTESETKYDTTGYGKEMGETTKELSEFNNVRYASKVHDFTGKLNLSYNWQIVHDIQGGVQVNRTDLTPRINAQSYYSQTVESSSSNLMPTSPEEKEEFYQNDVDDKSSLTSWGAFIEDDWNITSWLKMNIGLRLQGYSAESETHLAVEPRVAARLLIGKGTAIKASYARMSQGIFLLSSGNLITPSDVWISLTKEMKPAISDQVSLGISHELTNGIQLSVEGYYKRLDNVVDYKEGSSMLEVKSWRDMIAQGKGKAYGVEFLAEKTTGATRGHISYTWSKSLRNFDRPGMELNGGRDFYAIGDRRHNFNISITQRLSKNWDFSAAWILQSGRRANVATAQIHTGYLDSFGIGIHPDAAIYNPDTYLSFMETASSFKEKNDYLFPTSHRLDISFTHHGSIGIGEMICDISIYNLYNKQNISSVYWGYKNSRPALLGVCLFPIMPSITLTLKL